MVTVERIGDDMKILYLSTNYPLVSHTFIQNEILAVERQGWTVHPMALNAPRDGELLTELDQAESQRTTYVKSTGRVALLRLLVGTIVRHPGAIARGVIRAVRAGHGDLRLGMKNLLQFVEALVVWAHGEQIGVRRIHAHFGQAPATVAWFAAAFGNDIESGSWTWSVTIHGWHEFVSEEASLLKEKVAAATFVVCISDFTLSQLMRIADRSTWDELHIVRCGIDPAKFAFRPLPAPSDPPVVVTTARLSPEKGHLVLLRALAVLRDRGVVLRARLVGDGEMRHDLEAAAVTLGVAEQVEFLGALPPSAVADALASADAYCLPSFAEGLPVSIMEAMAVGVPVVTTYISGIPELVVDGVTGWVVPAGNVERLADALEAATAGPTRADVVDAARTAVLERHDSTRSGEQLGELFDRYHRVPDDADRSRDLATATPTGANSS